MATNLPTDMANTVLTSHAPTEEGVQTCNRNAAARKLLQAWLTDESGYEEETWPLLKRALEDNRSGGRKLFRD